MRHMRFYATPARRLCAPVCAHLPPRGMLRGAAEEPVQRDVCGRSPSTSLTEVDGVEDLAFYG